MSRQKLLRLAVIMVAYYYYRLPGDFEMSPGSDKFAVYSGFFGSYAAEEVSNERTVVRIAASNLRKSAARIQLASQDDRVSRQPARQRGPMPRPTEN